MLQETERCLIAVTISSLNQEGLLLSVKAEAFLISNALIDSPNDKMSSLVARFSYNKPVCLEHPSLSARRFQLIPQTITMIATPSMPLCKTIRTLNRSHNWGLYLWKCPLNRLNCLDDRSIFPWNWQFYPNQAPVHFVSRILNLSKQPIEKKTETRKATPEIYGT